MSLAKYAPMAMRGFARNTLKHPWKPTDYCLKSVPAVNRDHYRALRRLKAMREKTWKRRAGDFGIVTPDKVLLKLLKQDTPPQYEHYCAALHAAAVYPDPGVAREVWRFIEKLHIPATDKLVSLALRAAANSRDVDWSRQLWEQYGGQLQWLTEDSVDPRPEPPPPGTYEEMSLRELKSLPMWKRTEDWNTEKRFEHCNRYNYTRDAYSSLIVCLLAAGDPEGLTYLDELERQLLSSPTPCAEPNDPVPETGLDPEWAPNNSRRRAKLARLDRYKKQRPWKEFVQNPTQPNPWRPHRCHMGTSRSAQPSYAVKHCTNTEFLVHSYPTFIRVCPDAEQSRAMLARFVQLLAEHDVLREAYRSIHHTARARVTEIAQTKQPRSPPGAASAVGGKHTYTLLKGVTEKGLPKDPTPREDSTLLDFTTPVGALLSNTVHTTRSGAAVTDCLHEFASDDVPALSGLAYVIPDSRMYDSCFQAYGTELGLSAPLQLRQLHALRRHWSGTDTQGIRRAVLELFTTMEEDSIAHLVTLRTHMLLLQVLSIVGEQDDVFSHFQQYVLRRFKWDSTIVACLLTEAASLPPKQRHHRAVLVMQLVRRYRIKKTEALKEYIQELEPVLGIKGFNTREVITRFAREAVESGNHGDYRIPQMLAGRPLAKALA